MAVVGVLDTGCEVAQHLYVHVGVVQCPAKSRITWAPYDVCWGGGDCMGQ